MIDIEVVNSHGEHDFISPIGLFGAPYGEIYQQYIDGVPQNDFAMGTGMSDRPIMLWFDDENGYLRFSSESKSELKEFRAGVQYRHLPRAKLEVTLIT